MGEQRKLAAIMFTDIIGYSAMMSKDEKQALNILGKNREIHKSAIHEFNGELIKEIGDGTLSIFQTSSEAVNCAKAIQKVCCRESMFSVRIGIHIGEIVVIENDVFGDGVNIASRIEAAGKPGGIYISGRVYEDVKNKADIRAKFIGEKTLKNINFPVKVYSIFTGKKEGLSETILTEPGEIKEKSIIVLPFENISPDPDQEYLSDGLTEEIITDLSQIQSLRVISRNSAMMLKGTRKATTTIAKELNVQYVLEGSVRKAGNNLRVTANLIDAKVDTHLWAEKYRGTMDDIFDMQEKVSQSIVNALKIKLTPKQDKQIPEQIAIKQEAALSPEEKRVIEKKPTKNIEAYNLYLRGRYFSNKHTEDGFIKGIECFEQAINIDKKYALAFVGLAQCYKELSRLSFLTHKEGYPRAKKAVITALELDNSLGEAYATLGSLKMITEWDIYGPEFDFQRALELNPGSMEVYKLYTQYLTWIGKFDRGITIAKRAIELDPLTPFTNFNLGFIFFYAGHWDESINQLNNTLDLDPKFVWSHMYLAYNYVLTGMYDKAITYADNVISIWPTVHRTIPFGFMGWVYSKSGRQDKAQKLLEQLLALNKNDSFDPYCMAVIYSGLNEKDKAFNWLRQAYEAHSGLMVYLKIHSQYFFKSLVSDPQFGELLNKMGFM
ncbi:MAG: adenylate/guanylate cyclase domain-containing protein [Bacteroidales bacterium]|nr:adenylate/guanylate cyclase domain-containing protein [Bacteroidales bacterium]